MEIIGTNLTEKEQKNKKLMKLIIILIVILLLISIGLGVTIYVLRAQAFKFFIDGKSVASKNITQDLFVFEDDNVYISIKDIAALVGYKYYNGGYKQYTEKTNQCYVESIDEVCTFEKDSDKVYKNVPDSTDYEYFTLDMPVKKINNKLYTTMEGLGIACNVTMGYDKQKNQMTVYTLPYLVNHYTQAMNTSALTNFNNQKALRYGLVVVQDRLNTDTSSSTTGIKYGIYSTDGEEIVGTKYADMEFIESNQEFIVTTTEKTVGIVTADGSTKVKPQYDSLKQIDKNLNLYLATSNGKQGVIEKNGKILIYPEYEKIGIDATLYPSNEIKNQYLLFDNAIPVKRDGKWGLYDKKGNIILPIEYKEFGSIAGTSKDKTTNNLLIIPDVEGIVVAKEFNLGDNKKVTLYGIVNSLGKELVPFALETVYSVTVDNKDTYTMVNNGNSLDVLDYIHTYVNIDKLNEEDNTDTNTNTTTNNTTVNTITNTMTNQSMDTNILN
ncbi:MAG: WG repeat-containing protein [Clostridia bacterium]